MEKYANNEPEVLTTGVQNSLLKTEAFVNGHWINAASRKTFDVINPATGELIASIPDMNREDVREAVDAAYRAWPSFRETTTGERANLLKKWYALI
ncbi:MAG TPA: aldehyde dehydrogenase family protein, partial [Flavisolibacter sp.]|nr:aldehyde dehydrogenase family protein [Flavisolibacter sp.]